MPWTTEQIAGRAQALASEQKGPEGWSWGQTWQSHGNQGMDAERHARDMQGFSRPQSICDTGPGRETEAR